jgi:hypothetical protein
MPDRFSLRIESGDRAGEIVALSGRGLTVGRRPANDLSLKDSSVSGRHARLGIEGGSVVLVDFGSTNGTFVADQRVDEQELKPGDRLRFGSVELLFIDAEAGPPPAAIPAAAPAAAAVSDDDFDLEIDLDDDLDVDLDDTLNQMASPPATAVPAQAPPAPAVAKEQISFNDLDDDDDNEVHQIDAQALAQASKGRGPLPLVLAAVVVLGGAGWYFAGMPGLAGGGEQGADSSVREIVTVRGNLLADPSFEKEVQGAWDTSDVAPVAPYVDRSWRSTGDLGMGADLEAGEWALARSRELTLGAQRGLAAVATGFAEGDAVVELGISISDSKGEHPPVVAWSAPIRDDEGELSLELTAVPGYDTARVLLRTKTESGVGAGSFDDVSLVARAPEEVTSVGDFSVVSAGSDRSMVYHIDRPLLLDLGVAGSANSLTVNAEGMTFQAGTGAWSVVVDPDLLSQGMATLGAAGYRPHGDAFEDEQVKSVVIGRGGRQLRLVFGAPVTLKGSPLTTGYRLEANLTIGAVQLELGFTEERNQAGRLFKSAVAAASAGRRGEAVRTWQELLDEVPFDYDLVTKSEAGRAEMISSGLTDLSALRGDFERAKFFALPELFGACLAGARDLEAEFAGCEVERDAGLFGDHVEQQLRELTGPAADSADLSRLAILGYLDNAGHTGLAAQLRASLSDTSTGE